MNKIPVGATIAHAYCFTFKNFVKILGTIWASWLILIAVSAVQFYALVSQTNHWVTIAASFLSLFVQLLIYTIQLAGVMRLAQSLSSPSAFYLKIDKTTLKMFAGFICILGAMYLATIAATVAGIIAYAIVNTATNAASLAAKLSGATLGIVLIFSAPAFACAIVYALLRGTFLLAPSCVADGTFGIKKSWQLCKGNFWRIFVVNLAIFIPVFIVICAFEWVIFLKAWIQVFKFSADRAQVRDAEIAMLTQLFHPWQIMVPLVVTFGTVVSTVFIGLFSGAQMFAYRVLTGDLVPITADTLPD